MTPTEYGFGFDFWDIWQFGRAALSGLDPWALKESFYPPAAVYFLFAHWALVPMAFGFALLTAESVIALVISAGRKALPLLLFFPVIASLAQGQISLLFLPLIVLLPRKNWASVAAACLLTIKPQIAITVLPWYFVRWLRDDRKLAAGFVLGSLALHLSPLIINPSAMAHWIASMSAATANKTSMAAGLWQFDLPLPFMILAAGASFLIAILQPDEKTARAITTFFNPILSYYDTAFLFDCAPLPVLILSGLAALGLSHLLGSFLPFTLISGVVLAYRLFVSPRNSCLTNYSVSGSIAVAKGDSR